MVKDAGDDFVKKPTSWTWIWDDSGSGADNDVAIYRLNPPNGYKCLGMVAVQGYTHGPDLNRYRCVKQDLVKKVTLKRQIWNDAGSGATNDFTAYAIDDTSPNTFPMGLFFGQRNHNFATTIQNTVVFALLDEKVTEY